MSIGVEDFHKTYGETVAAAGISFPVAPGEILGLLGPNGAGKTTTPRALAGILAPTRGRLLLDGHDVVEAPIAARAALACVPDDPQRFDRRTVREYFRFIAAACCLPPVHFPSLGRAIVSLATGGNRTAAWPVVALCGAARVPLVALAFNAFDVSRDTPA